MGVDKGGAACVLRGKNNRTASIVRRHCSWRITALSLQSSDFHHILLKQLCVSIGLGTFAGRQPMPPPCPFCPSLTSSPHPHSSFVDPLRPVRRAARLLRLPLRLDCVAHLQRRQLLFARLNPCPVFRSATPTPRLAACCLLLPTDRDVHHHYHHHFVAAIASAFVANP